MKSLTTLAVAAGACCVMAGSASAADDQLFNMNDPMAAFLESNLYAEKMGASAEFRKMEAVALDKKNNKVYFAMSSIDKTMSDGKGDIKLPENKCGIVYEADLDSNYNISSLKPAVVGGPYDKSVKSTVVSGFKDRCDVNNIANPDGLYVDKDGILWISEDTSNHVNNILWRWDGKKLERFASVPTGAEITGITVSDNDDVFFNIQHPTAYAKYPYNRGIVGIVNGFKSGDSFAPIDVPAGDDIFDVKVAAGSYQVLERVGEPIPNDIRGNRYGQVDRVDGSLKIMCNHPDGNGYIPLTESGDEGLLFTNYECRPGTVAKVYMKRNGDKWDVLDGENIDFAPVKGTWNNCNASATPWKTQLVSEEYEPTAGQAGWQENVKDMSDFLGEQANPYDYGYPVELIPNRKGELATTTVVKHYNMGRLSYEMSRVMDDHKTVYSGNDGTGMPLFKYIADKEGDLSAGTLYAAKITQQGDESLAIKWIELGRSNDSDVFDAIRAVVLK